MERAETLSEDGQRRLERLAKEWEAIPGRGLSFTPSDLRLLLEHFIPLRALIRDLIVAEQQTPSTAQPRGVTAGLEALSAELPDSARAGVPNVKSANTQRELEGVRRELVRAQTERNQVDAKLEKCLGEIKALKSERKQLQSQLQQVTETLAAAESRMLAARELDLLRRDQGLAEEMGLASLPDDDTHALIQVVAVLSQLDNLKRLWEILRDRCESGKRPATEGESALLHAALAWHNYNWRSLPYRLIDASPGSRYDYETQLRSRHVTKGDAVAALHLHGVADGAGKILCKALVWTQ